MKANELLKKDWFTIFQNVLNIFTHIAWNPTDKLTDLIQRNQQYSSSEKL